MAARWAAISIVMTPVCPGDRLGKSGNLAGAPHTAAASDRGKQVSRGKQVIRRKRVIRWNFVIRGTSAAGNQSRGLESDAAAGRSSVRCKHEAD
jgi:hypothetical protein